MSPALSRRDVLRGTGALILAFGVPHSASALTETGASATPLRGLPGSLDSTPRLNAWIRIEADGNATIFTGKAELGQGIKTALLQIAAEELKLPLPRITLITADTARTPNEGYTAASHSVQDSGTAIRNAAAQVREILIGEAARRVGRSTDGLKAWDGVITGPDNLSFGYGELVSAQLLNVDAQPTSILTDPKNFAVMDRPVARVDIPPKLTGGAAYVQDMRLPGMVHGRIVRPPSYGARLIDLDAAPVEAMPGVLKVVRDGAFIGVVAEKQWTAIQAMRRLAASARWNESAALPDEAQLPEALMALPTKDTTILDVGTPDAASYDVDALFSRPYLSHGSIGPSCAIAHMDGEDLTVWTHTQGVYPLRDALATLCAMPRGKVRCIHVEGAGCYGQNGADDVGADAALLARALPGRPVRVQWMREQEHAWEPFGPGMAAHVRASLGPDGSISAWQHDVWSQSHMMRPGPPGTLLAARDIANPFLPAPPVDLPMPEGGGDRNAVPLYVLPNARAVNHFLPQMPLRGSSMRSLGGYLNVFAIESTMDDLARLSGQDPVAFRLRHLRDERASAVITLAAERFGWNGRPTLSAGSGYGFAFARYKNLEAYCAIALELAIDQDTGRTVVQRAIAAVDTGQVVNPDGVRNQIEGGIVQATSWTLFEGVRFDRQRITSVDWASYPILRFAHVPRRVEVHLVERPGLPFLGAGEAAQGPMGAAIANAIRDITGTRLRALPLDAAKVRAASKVRPASMGSSLPPRSPS
ncbi:xanthine dehydrogenase family protein molybdopterin-binding subunit [Ancylobacter pratisalsi]|uniref:Xanthine dehydrogenase family protein molybdopterin-binding subunit n=1 Tax=Ancylobacter pratisalsi TaxID=1745854 RepID=A0A6P1YLT2_9HYPH|nr:molybdopterin cofactor-binding domain-containing protein [Ancylobacter pratisalsi]QIB34328.1 xanthine dehydrogenase family protein molybdopterin-binding subunit [Ancylobacter pratisalsi]